MCYADTKYSTESELNWETFRSLISGLEIFFFLSQVLGEKKKSVEFPVLTYIINPDLLNIGFYNKDIHKFAR